MGLKLDYVVLGRIEDIEVEIGPIWD